MIDGYSIEMAAFMCAVVMGAYTQIGGLGATFYASYFNTLAMFVGILILTIKVFFSGESDPDFALGTCYTLVHRLQTSCITTSCKPSFLTAISNEQQPLRGGPNFPYYYLQDYI